MEKEIWKPIKGYEGIYEASTLGRIKSVDRVIEYSNGIKHFTKGKILNPSICKKTGYFQVSLCKDGDIKKIDVHRIIANTFLENKENLPCVNHKDETRVNNEVTNLEFCTHKYNINYGTTIKRMKNSIRSKPNKTRSVSQFDFNGKKIKTYDCLSDVLKDGFLPCCVQSCCNTKTKDLTHKKFIWVYKENEHLIGDILKVLHQRKRNSKNTPIKMYNIKGDFIGTYKSAAEIERIYNIDHTSVSRCCRGLQKTSNNYTFKYAE